MKRYFYSKSFVGFFLIINLLSVNRALACQCNLPFICEAYSKSQAVFTGKVEKIETDDSIPGLPVKVLFSVKKSYKGASGKFETANFSVPECGPKFMIGKEYFVYKMETFHYCNRTGLLSDSRNEVEYAESLSENNPRFTIYGGFEYLSGEASSKPEVTIEKGVVKYTPEIYKNGSFNLKVKEAGKYKIKISLPYQARISLSEYNFYLPAEMKIDTNSLRTTLEYEVEFKPNDCDMKTFYISKAN